MAFSFKKNGMINRLLLHHVRGHYRWGTQSLMQKTVQPGILTTQKVRVSPTDSKRR